MEFKFNGKKVVLRGTRQFELQWMQGRPMSKQLEGQGKEMYSVWPSISLNLIHGNNQQLQTKIQGLLEEFNDVFAIPTCLPPNRRLIRKSNSPFSSPVVMVKKKDGSWRMCIDYRQLNQQTIKDKFPVPVIEELIIELYRSKTLLEEVHSGIFFDDILVYSSSMEAHVHHLRQVLEVMRKHTLYAKMSKCVFGTTQVEYLGHIISKEGVAIDPSKIKGYALITQPLTALLKKNAFNWSDEATKSFHALQQAMVKSLVLALPNFNKEFTIETDAFGHGVGAVFQQEGHPIAFLSKTLAPKHQSLAAYEKELLAVVLALQKWRGYLLDRHFQIRIDHFSIKYVLNQRITTPFQAKWLPKLIGFDYEIDYKKGKDNVVADALSRIQQPGQLFQILLTIDSNELVEAVKATWSSDPTFKFVILSLQQGHSKNSRYTWSANELRRKGKLVMGNNEQLRLKLVSHLHESPIGGHSGVQATMKRSGKTFLWTSLRHCPYFWDNVYKLHGLPSTIVSDRDKVFLSLFWQSLFKMLKVQLCMSTTYHPQSNGQIEAVNKCVETYLRCMTGERPREWIKGLSLAEYWYNTNFHSSIKTTPFEVLYCQTPPIHTPYVAKDCSVELVDRNLQAREQAITMLKFHLKAAQDMMKTYDDKKRSKREFAMGD
ncbi:gypsy/ty3 retroelement polyprotein [Tanacetum coccineum]